MWVIKLSHASAKFVTLHKKSKMHERCGRSSGGPSKAHMKLAGHHFMWVMRILNQHKKLSGCNMSIILTLSSHQYQHTLTSGLNNILQEFFYEQLKDSEKCQSHDALVLATGGHHAYYAWITQGSCEWETIEAVLILDLFARRPDEAHMTCMTHWQRPCHVHEVAVWKLPMSASSDIQASSDMHMTHITHVWTVFNTQTRSKGNMLLVWAVNSIPF